MNILVTNDDSVNAKGIAALVEVAKTFGTVTVVAPDSHQSGQGHAITITDPIKLKKVSLYGDDIVSYACSGTPVDSVKLARSIIFKNRTIDLCLSGINHGSNASLNVIYSGTMSAAMEASISGTNSIGFSLMDFDSDADFSASKYYAKKIIAQLISNPYPKGTLLNVNIPKGKISDIKGCKVCQQGQGKWIEDFIEREDPIGRKYYWMSGKFDDLVDCDKSDLKALSQNYISIVPTKYDLTDYDKIKPLKYFENI